MYSLGGGASQAPLQKKALEISYRVEMHVYSPVFQGQLIEKKIRSITFRFVALVIKKLWAISDFFLHTPDF